MGQISFRRGPPGTAPRVRYNGRTMTSDPYLPRLTARLGDGLAALPEAFRARHAGYLKSAQNPDGGWPGREGGSDLYYTGFALRGLAVLGELTPDVAGRTA